MFTIRNLAYRRLVILAFVLAWVPPVGAAELRTYEFLSGQDRLFQFQGGLLGTDVQAQLAGSFDVEIMNDGTSRLTRFDVQLVDILDQGFSPLGWSEGTSLADVLFVNPVGLTGYRDAALITLGDPGVIIDFETGMPNTIIRVGNLGGGLANVRISSSMPEMVIDSPSFATESPGLLVRVVPEPGATTLLTGVLIAVGGRRRWRRAG